MPEGIQVEQCSSDSQYLVTYRTEGRLVAAKFASKETVGRVTSELCEVMTSRHQEFVAFLTKIGSR